MGHVSQYLPITGADNTSKGRVKVDTGAPAGTISAGAEVNRIYVHSGTTQGNRQSATVQHEGEVRGLPPGTYGLTLGAIPGITSSDAAIGMLEFIWEERPVPL